jgi:subtilisin family serine protease
VKSFFVNSQYLVLTAISVGFHIGSQPTFADNPKVTVLVIDQGVDFDNTTLKNSKHELVSEKSGQLGVDDNTDGFVDNISGWNQISQDPVFMPDYIVEEFTKNPEQVRSDLQTYSGIENNDRSAIEKYMQDKDLQSRLNRILEFAHGTHVAGIVQGQAGGSADIHSINIMSASTENSSQGLLEIANKALAVGAIQAKDVEDILSRPILGSDEFKSIFDSPEILAEIARRRANANIQFMTSLNKYIKSLNPRVVNMSFGLSFLSVVEQLLGIWSYELKEAGLDPKTPMTDNQRKAVGQLARVIFSQVKSEWSKLISENPSILFVAAAGNDGRGADSDYGNIEMFDSVPASLAESLPNLVTVVASGDKGKLADFSSFSRKRTTLAAPGVAIVSKTPGDLDVAMSGTSMASPFVAGLAARVFETNKNLNPEQVKTLMIKTVDSVESLKDKTLSGGVISSEKLLLAAQKTNSEKFETVVNGLSSIVSFDTLERVFNLSPFERDSWNRGVAETDFHQTPAAVKQVIRSLF